MSSFISSGGSGDDFDDYELSQAIALSLQEVNNNQALVTFTGAHCSKTSPPKSKKETALQMSVIDPVWETIDPNPNIFQLFRQFDKEYFYGRLGMVEVKWSPQMTLCAGVCSYQGRGGLCSVRLSQPLLKFRPRKDLVETLLHEMIHAYLFVTENNRDRDGHGPEFHKHMYRINNASGANITVFHSFHDEVAQMRQHWWRCDGVCRDKKPFYGFVKRAKNRAPGKYDRWWSDHQMKCGGNFIKIKEPENYKNKKIKAKPHEKSVGKNGKAIDEIFASKTPSTSTKTAVKLFNSPKKIPPIKVTKATTKKPKTSTTKSPVKGFPKTVTKSPTKTVATPATPGQLRLLMIEAAQRRQMAEKQKLSSHSSLVGKICKKKVVKQKKKVKVEFSSDDDDDDELMRTLNDFESSVIEID